MVCHLRMRMSHGLKNKNESWYVTHVITHVNTAMDSILIVTWRVRRCDVTISYVWHDAFVCVIWRDMTRSYVWHDAFVCFTWRIRTCDMTRSYVWHDAFVRVIWRIRMCAMTPSYIYRDAFICVTWLICMCDVTRSYVWHDWFVWVTWCMRTCDMRTCDMMHSYSARVACECVMSHTWLSNVTHINASFRT